MTDSGDQVSLNLGNIQTQWSMVRRAHQATMAGGESSSAARQALVMRYGSAIRRFVQIVVRDPELADELSQDAMVRLLKGDFAGADPDRGRFRDLLKTALRNMARNHWVREKRRKPVDFDLSLVDDTGDDPVAAVDDIWSQQWRDNLMSIVWERLHQWEQEQTGSIAWTLLRMRSEFPDESSSQLAERLSQAVGRPLTAEATRQQLRRARVRFVEFLVAEIADGLADPTPDLIRDELVALGLYNSVKDVLPTDGSK